MIKNVICDLTDYKVKHDLELSDEDIDTAIKALELIELLHNRPCEACKHRKENGCCRWTCDFDEMIYGK